MSAASSAALGSVSSRRADNVETNPRLSEDWLSVIIDLLIFALALGGLANPGALLVQRNSKSS